MCVNVFSGPVLILKIPCIINFGFWFFHIYFNVIVYLFYNIVTVFFSLLMNTCSYLHSLLQPNFYSYILIYIY